MLATSALFPGEKIRFKNRTLLDCLPLAIFPRYAAKNQGIPVGKGVTKRHPFRRRSLGPRRRTPWSRLRRALDRLRKRVYFLPTQLGRNG